LRERAGPERQIPSGKHRKNLRNAQKKYETYKVQNVEEKYKMIRKALDKL